MKQIKLFLLIFTVVFSLVRVPYCAEPATSWLRTRTVSNVLNPNISIIGDFVGNTGPMSDSNSNRFSFREAELGIQAEVDPYARADFFLGAAEGGNYGLEEGYITLLSLPWNLKARGGKFRANFGKLNMTHPHELTQVDVPLVLSEYLGEEGLNDTGIEVSRIFAPFGLFVEASYAFLNGVGDSESSSSPKTTVTDTNGSIVTVDVNKNESTTERQLQNFASISRVRFYKDLSDDSNFELGVSGLLHQPKEKDQTKMGGLDLTFRWKPLKEGLYKSFIWRTELLYSQRRLIPETDAVTGLESAGERNLHRRGTYSYAEWQPVRRWKFGIRGDYLESPNSHDSTLTLSDGTTRTVERNITRMVSPYITFTLSEFNRFRIQFQHKITPSEQEEHRVYLQWTVVLGPHGAHLF